MKMERIPVDGAKLRARRERLRLSTIDLAARLKMDYSRVALWELGGEIHPEHLYALAKVLHCRMTDLLPGEWTEKQRRAVNHDKTAGGSP